MKTWLRVPTLAITMLILATSFVYGAFGVTAVPNQIPKGAYVNGSDGDQHFFISVNVELAADADWADGDDFVITLPSGVTIGNTDGDANYDDEVYFVVATTNNLAITNADITVTASTITVNVDQANTAGVAAGDKLAFFFPIITEEDPSSSTVVIAFTTTNADLSDTNPDTDVTITYVDQVDKITWSADYTGGDQSSTKGDVYPSAAADISDGLLDFITALDAGGGTEVQECADGASDHFGLIAGNLDGDDATDEITYTLWASQDSGLARVSYDNAHRPIQTTDNAVVPTANEDDTFDGGAAGAGAMYTLDGTRLAEGNWWFYVTSNLTNEWPLGRSDSVDIRHWPTFNTTNPDDGGGFDYNVDGDYDKGGAGADNVTDVTLESGGTIGKDGALVSGGNNLGSLDFFWDFEDVDDNADLDIFLSDEDDLTAADLTITGSQGSEVVTDIGTGATKITSTAIEEEGSTGYFTYDIYTDADTYEDAGDFYVYYVANDGKNQTVYQLFAFAGVDGADEKIIHVKHYPYFKFDDVYATDPVTLETGTDDYYVIIGCYRGPVGGMNPD